jgi:hypothetical protein
MSRKDKAGYRVIGLAMMVVGLFTLPFILGGCDNEDCVNCVEMPPPVVPTGVHSISQHDRVIVQWLDISYFPYDGNYSPNVVTYVVYGRFFEDSDLDDPNREFVVLGEVDWDENFDPDTGLHWFDDMDVAFGERYEYAVSAVNAAGQESALSFEIVTDALVYFGESAVRIFGADGPADQYSINSGFDFSDLFSQPVNPWATTPTYDIRVLFEDGIPYVQTAGPSVRIQDFGVFTDGYGNLVFEGVSWAPADYYSLTGKLELIMNHIYVLEIDGEELHYAKFGVVSKDDISVGIEWAYQTIPGLPELKAVPEPVAKPENRKISL